MHLFPPTRSVSISCRELDGFLVEQCTVDTDTSTGQSVPAIIGNFRKTQYKIICLLNSYIYKI